VVFCPLQAIQVGLQIYSYTMPIDLYVCIPAAGDLRLGTTGQAGNTRSNRASYRTISVSIYRVNPSYTMSINLYVCLSLIGDLRLGTIGQAGDTRSNRICI